MADVKELESQLSEAQRLAREANDARVLAENRLAEAIADGLGLKVGCVVAEKKSIGYGENRHERTQRYKVTGFRYRSYGKVRIAIFGKTIRKNGTLGDRHEIYGDWTVEMEVTHD